jgi:bacteriorhodopsin
MGWAAFGVIIYKLAISARATAQKRGTQSLFLQLSIYTIVIWTLYPM